MTGSRLSTQHTAESSAADDIDRTPESEPPIAVTSDPERGDITVVADMPVPPERVFRALASPEICQWWVRPGVFDTRQWTGDVRITGRWAAEGTGNGRPYRLEGEFLEVAPPKTLAHTWQGIGLPGGPTTVTYRLEPCPAGTRLTLHHTGFTVPETCTATHLGWETSLRQLARLLAAEHATG